MKHDNRNIDIYCENDVVKFTMIVEHDDVRYAIHSTFNINDAKRATCDDVSFCANIVNLNECAVTLTLNAR